MARIYTRYAMQEGPDWDGRSGGWRKRGRVQWRWRSMAVGGGGCGGEGGSMAVSVGVGGCDGGGGRLERCSWLHLRARVAERSAAPERFWSALDAPGGGWVWSGVSNTARSPSDGAANLLRVTVPASTAAARQICSASQRPRARGCGGSPLRSESTALSSGRRRQPCPPCDQRLSEVVITRAGGRSESTCIRIRRSSALSAEKRPRTASPLRPACRNPSAHVEKLSTRLPSCP